jgi:hypothetical protein
MNSVSSRVDNMIAHYRKEHLQQHPLYIILSPDDGKKLVEEIRQTTSISDDHLVTKYKDAEIKTNLSIEDGKGYVGNELPETGS